VARVAPFIYEQPRETQELIQTAPVIDGGSRPNTGGAALNDVNGDKLPAGPRTGAAAVAQK
jgi:hypothetical protein